jgi:hypothetical protein
MSIYASSIKDKKLNTAKKTAAPYEKLEMDLLRNALKMSHTERFFLITQLMKMDIMLRNAKITQT